MFHYLDSMSVFELINKRDFKPLTSNLVGNPEASFVAASTEFY